MKHFKKHAATGLPGGGGGEEKNNRDIQVKHNKTGKQQKIRSLSTKNKQIHTHKHMHMTHMTVKNMPCRADPSRNVMSMNKGVSKIQLRMKTHVLPFFSKCSPFQKPTQTKKKTWTLTPHDLYLPMPSQAWLPASLRPGRGCKEKIRKATNPNGR